MRYSAMIGCLFLAGCLFDTWRQPPPEEWLYAGQLVADNPAVVFERYERRKDGWRLADALIDSAGDGVFDIAIVFLGEQFGRQIDTIMPAAPYQAARRKEAADQRPPGISPSPLLRRIAAIGQRTDAGLEAIKNMREGMRDDRWLASLALYWRGGSYHAQLASLLRITDEPAMVALALAGQGPNGVQELAKAIAHPWPGANWPALYLAALGKRAAPAVPLLRAALRQDGPHLASTLRVLLAVADEDSSTVASCLPEASSLCRHGSREVACLANYLMEKINDKR